MRSTCPAKRKGDVAPANHSFFEFTDGGGVPGVRDVSFIVTANKEVTESNAPVGAALIAQAMDRREGAGRYKAMQSIMDWDNSRLVYHAVKRAFDIVFSGCALAVIAIPSLVLATAIRLESEGNPFYAAASFRYDDTLSKAENREKAREFLKQVQRGDYFQMAADYYYGVGAHSMLFIADYDPETDSVHWADSNMKGKSVNGVRYAYVQYDAVKPIDWFVDAFCRKKYGATIYRLRDDIVYAE